MSVGLHPLIVIIEDDPDIRRFVADALRNADLDVCEAAKGGAGIDAVAERSPQAVILDLGLPDMDGVEVIQRIRTWSTIPILILSARTTEDAKIDALDAGADDYLTKPFGVGELLARVRALLRRLASVSGPGEAIRRFSDVEVDLSRQLVRRAGEGVHLTQIEFRLLAVLLANDGRVLTHRHLMREVWGPGYAGQEHYLRVYVRKLRQKLESDPTRPSHLLTETGVGYRFQS